MVSYGVGLRIVEANYRGFRRDEDRQRGVCRLPIRAHLIQVETYSGINPTLRPEVDTHNT